MTGPTIAVEQIPAIGHDEAMDLAATEYDRVLRLADDLVDGDWSRPTDCTDWDVRDMLGHLLGMLEQQADAEERTRQFAAAAGTRPTDRRRTARRDDRVAGTRARPSEYAGVTAIAARRRTDADSTARRATTGEQRAATFDVELPGEATVDVRLSVRHHLHPRPMDAPHRHQPGNRTARSSCRRRTTVASSPMSSRSGHADIGSRSL